MTRPQHKNDDFSKLFKNVEADGVLPIPSEGLSSRAVALFDQKHSSQKLGFEFNIWKLWSGVSTGLALVLLILQLNGGSARPDFQASMDSVVAFEIPLQDLPTQTFATAHIELSRGAQFYSNARESIGNHTTLVVEWSQLLQKNSLPVVVRAMNEGVKTVTVSFYDEKENLIATRELSIDFIKSIHGGT